MHPANIQINLCIRTFWSESSPSAFRIAKEEKFLHADYEDISDICLSCVSLISNSFQKIKFYGQKLVIPMNFYSKVYFSIFFTDV